MSCSVAASRCCCATPDSTTTSATAAACSRSSACETDIALRIEGSLHTKVSQMIERFGDVLDTLLAAGLTPIPYIHGDTLTSMAVGVSSYLHKVACVHVEAGIRTITPRADVLASFYRDFQAGTFDWDAYAAAMRDADTFERGSREPFPEQFNTRVSDAATGYPRGAGRAGPRLPARRGLPGRHDRGRRQHGRRRHGCGARRRRPGHGLRGLPAAAQR